MSSTMKVNIKKDFEIKSDLLIIGAQDGQNKFSANSKLSELTNNSISATLNAEKKFSSDNKKVLIYNNSAIKQVALYGYSKDKNLDKVRSLGADISSYANTNKATNVSIDLKSFTLSNKNIQAFIEGLSIIDYLFNVGVEKASSEVEKYKKEIIKFSA